MPNGVKRNPLIAVDSNVLLGRANDDELVIDALDTVRRRLPACELIVTPTVIEEVPVLLVNDQLASAQFDERVLGQEAEESLLVPDEEFQQFIIVNVAGGDEQKLGRTLAEFVSNFEVRVFGDQHASFLVRQGQQGWIGGAVLLAEIERVDDVMPALLEPEREPARQLGIDQELHAARGRMRWTLESRAAKARQALMSSRSRSG